MSRKYKIITSVLLIMISFFVIRCTDFVDEIPSGDSSQVSPIHFQEYNLDSINKKWGYDSLNSIYSAPIRGAFDFVCGIKVRIDSMPYDTVKIQEKTGYNFIDSIKPSRLNLGANYIDVFMGNLDRETGLDIFGGNAASRGLSDHYGGAIKSINLKSYNILEHRPLKYYIGSQSPQFKPNPDTIKNGMNRIIHQAVVHVATVDTMTLPVTGGYPFFDVIRKNGCLDYINTWPGGDSQKVYNRERWLIDSITSQGDTNICRIVQVKDIRYGWRVINALKPSDTTLAIDPFSLDFIKTNEQMILIDGNNINTWEYVWIKKRASGIGNEFLILTKGVTNSYNRNSYIIYALIHHVAGIALPEKNLCFVRDGYTQMKFLENLCHEFMHLKKNGSLGHVNDNNERNNLMYFENLGSSQKILKFRCADSWTMQWNQAHSGY